MPSGVRERGTDESSSSVTPPRPSSPSDLGPQLKPLDTTSDESYNGTTMWERRFFKMRTKQEEDHKLEERGLAPVSDNASKAN